MNIQISYQKNKNKFTDPNSLSPLALEFHKTMQDIDNWIDKWIEYKSKEQEKKYVRQIGDFL